MLRVADLHVRFGPVHSVAGVDLAVPDGAHAVGLVGESGSDEPTSAVDVTVQDQVLTLLERLREEREVSYLFVSHNLAVVERLCESVVVLYHGRVAETGPTPVVLGNPAHPYTVALRSAVPEL